MKKIITLFFITVFLMLSFNKAFGGVTIGHIDYSLNSEKYTATLQYVNPEAIVAGVLTIPQFVTYEKKNYEVVEIGDHVCSDSSVKQLLEWINFPVSIEVVGEGAFENCINLWSCSWPGDATKKIGACAFAGCKKLQDFSFPPLLEKIGGRALAGCTDIQALIIGGELEEVPFGLCEGCTSLTEVVVFSGLFHRMKKIQDNAFDGCTNLGLVIICPNLTYLGEAFTGCNNLTHVTSFMTVPPRISSNTFEHPERIRLEIPKGTAQIYKNTPHWDMFFDVEETDMTEEELAAGVKSIKADSTNDDAIYSITGKRTNVHDKGIKIIKRNGKYIKVLK